MLGVKFYNLFFERKSTLIISFLFLIFLSLKRISNIILIFQIQGFTLFIVLVQIGEKIMKYPFKVIFVKISILSYNIFLIHHKVILDILGVINPTRNYFQIILLLIIIIITIILAEFLYLIVNIIMNFNLFKKLERFFIK